MVGNGGEVGQHFFRRQSSVNSPRRLSRNVDARDFDSLMEFPKPLQRGVSFRAPAPVVQQQAQVQHTNVPQHSTSRSGCQKHVWVAFLLCLSGFLVLYLSYLRRNPFLSQSPQVPSKGYGVVIDIGRREARITVIQFVDAPGTLTVHVLGSEHSVAPLNFETPNGGYDVSAFVELLEYAKRTIPEPVRPQTRVYVLGTGGLEWIPAVNRDVLLEECRNIIHESAFQFHDEWAMVISGRDEGVYEWVAANYARGIAQSGAADTIGVLTLGDKSAQVTFVAEEIPPLEYLHQVELWGTMYNLYSYSFETLGLETASKSLLKFRHANAAHSSRDGSGNEAVGDPCTPQGLAGAEGDTTTAVNAHPTVPMGNFTACRAESLALLQQGRGACVDKNCPIGAVFVPELQGNFIATRKFFQTSKYFSLPAMASLADLAAAGEKYCGQGAGGHKGRFPRSKEVRQPCFSAAFIVAFLHDSLSLPIDGNKVVFTDVVNSVPVEWTLGFFLTHSDLLEDKVRSSRSVVISGEFLGNVALFLGILALVGILLGFVTRWQRPQIKTIYDLEKGKYFTTAARGR